MKLKIPPVLQTFIIIVLIILVDKFLISGEIDIKGKRIIVFVMLFISIYIGIAAIFEFKKVKTTVDPINPDKASQLVKTGIYKISRNPMYLALALGLFSISIWLSNIYNLIILALFIWYITIYQIKPEEKILIKLFGDEYKLYCQKVRRWI